MELQDFHGFNINPKHREIFLHNFFGNDDQNQGVEFKMANVFLKKFKVFRNLVV